MPFRSLALASALALSPLAVLAAPWTLDTGHTHVTFSIDHLGFSTTQAQFRTVSAEVDFDPDNIEAAQVAFTIDAASFDSNLEARDNHVRGADFLNVEEYPEITFISTGVTQTGEGTADVTGDLTMLGITKPVTFQAELRQIAPSPFNPDLTVAGFVVTGEIDRTAFDMGYGAPAIGTVIPVRVDLELSPSDQVSTQ
ncbi:YceI family protein [Oceanomicrobium pacificus]|uniref:Polyisoprenoid-binding protein n=1 Tax=Oceanomicrobium pacificus TaxID=2692916 RepID=A0A6B0TMZ0_9RHOB|nr:YceI family protein [Oceanomicrobium pacificus]MXU63939.1 polyisoprenoid-binding protein [Oceanomicrobium pacificus]